MDDLGHGCDCYGLMPYWTLTASYLYALGRQGHEKLPGWKGEKSRARWDYITKKFKVCKESADPDWLHGFNGKQSGYGENWNKSLLEAQRKMDVNVVAGRFPDIE